MTRLGSNNNPPASQPLSLPSAEIKGVSYHCPAINLVLNVLSGRNKARFWIRRSFQPHSPQPTASTLGLQRKLVLVGLQTESNTIQTARPPSFPGAPWCLGVSHRPLHSSTSGKFSNSLHDDPKALLAASPSPGSLLALKFITQLALI